MLPLVLGGGILYWMYRDFAFDAIEHILFHEMDWTWMLLSLPFGILAQAFRGWRWKQSLEPIGEQPRNSVCVNAVFMSYASSLVVPRVGEFARCGILGRYDGVSFSKALGTVLTERIVDTLIVLFITLFAFATQIGIFNNFFSTTGTRIDTALAMFSATGWVVTFICGISACFSFYLIFKKLAVYERIKSTLSGMWQGVSSLRRVKSMPLFLFYSLAIWGSYFLHFYLTFFCFDATASLGATCALLCFVVGSIAVIVPTPNGAGPWHFAVKTMLILYGVTDEKALYFVLIVHTIQTLLVILLGIYAGLSLAFTKPKNHQLQATL